MGGARRLVPDPAGIWGQGLDRKAGRLIIQRRRRADRAGRHATGDVEHMDIKAPYLLFLGDAADQLAAKVAIGIKQWRPEKCVGQLRLPGCSARAARGLCSGDDGGDTPRRARPRAAR